MSDSPETKADTAAAPKKAAVVKKKVVKTAKRVVGIAVKNISDRLINTSIGSIPPGESGRCSVAESHSYGKYLEKIDE